MRTVKNYQGIRNFYYLNYKANIKWALENPKKKTFIDMVGKTPRIKKCGEYQDEDIVKFIWGTQQEALNNNEIKAYDIDALIYNGWGFTDATISYINKHTDVDVDEYFDFNFNQFWRSIVNF